MRSLTLNDVVDTQHNVQQHPQNTVGIFHYRRFCRAMDHLCANATLQLLDTAQPTVEKFKATEARQTHQRRIYYRELRDDRPP